ncbi:hypothetical protein GIV75_30190 [Pseudomonas sp. PA-3-5D]|uniref:hypothetical protein n=1 Tax=unclassified Pseudomonas TaxID=196821 RepID=UPI001F295D49|nr:MULTISPECIES: hypothetical protein [unclassified Pseudomonas]MCF5511628.1 hypothetical protein [Pseudomonas sp. PA-3-6H]MCF5565094.1 hypothetical protein [Pseudomonas sp. PA-3-5D]
MRKVFASAIVREIEYRLGDKNKAMIQSWYDADCDVREGMKPFKDYYNSLLSLELPKELYWLIEDSTKTKYCKEQTYKHDLSQADYDGMYHRFGLDLDFEFRYDNRNGVNKMVRLKDYLESFVSTTLNSDASFERRIEVMKIEMLTLNQVFYQAFSERVMTVDTFITNPQ